MYKTLNSIIITLTSIILVLCSCSKTVEPDIAAKKFIQAIDSVDAKTAESFASSYNSLYSADPESVPKIETSMIEENHKKFVPLVTSNFYMGLLQNRTYYQMMKTTYDKNCTFRCEKVSLTPSHVETESIEYNYTAQIAIIDNESKKEQVGSEEGIVSVAKEHGVWKVDFIRVITRSEVLMP